MKQAVNSIVLISVLVIILLAVLVIGWRHFFPEAPAPDGSGGHANHGFG
jgi:hypothetical protein